MTVDEAFNDAWNSIPSEKLEVLDNALLLSAETNHSDNKGMVAIGGLIALAGIILVPCGKWVYHKVKDRKQKKAIETK